MVGYKASPAPSPLPLLAQSQAVMRDPLGSKEGPAQGLGTRLLGHGDTQQPPGMVLLLQAGGSGGPALRVPSGGVLGQPCSWAPYFLTVALHASARLPDAIHIIH